MDGIELVAPNRRSRIRVSPKGAMVVSGETMIAGRMQAFLRSERGFFPMLYYCGRHPGKILRTPQGEFKLKHPLEDALHSLGNAVEWEIESRQAEMLVLHTAFAGETEAFNSPAPFEARVTYSLFENVFGFMLWLKNIGPDLLPAVIGGHPFFLNRHGHHKKLPVVTFSAERYFPFHRKHKVPIGGVSRVPKKFKFDRRRLTENDRLDHCYYDWSGGEAIADWPEPGFRIVVRDRTPGRLRHLHFWTDHDEVFAFEPQTGVADAFAPRMARVRTSGAHYLRAGEEMSISFDMVLEDYGHMPGPGDPY